MNVAHTILRQLGGGQFITMTGASRFISDGNTLRMSLKRNASKANRLYITLDADDTYTMRFFRFTSGRYNKKTLTFTEDKETEIFKESGIYADQLQSFFTQVTGMYTSLH